MLDPTTTILAFIVGICGSFVGSQVGSSGSIIIPSMIFLGASPHSAIAVHRLSTLVSSLTALRNYSKANKVKWKYTIPFMIIFLVGGIIGAKIMLGINAQVLSKAVGFVILIPLFFLFFDDFGVKHKKTSKLMHMTGYPFLFLISIWSGIFPPGGLTLTLYILVFFFGLTLIEGKATMIFPKLLSRVVVIGIFIYEGIMIWQFAIPLAIGAIIGSHIGSKTAIKGGDKWVRLLLAFVVSALATKLIFF